MNDVIIYTIAGAFVGANGFLIAKMLDYWLLKGKPVFRLILLVAAMLLLTCSIEQMHLSKQEGNSNVHTTAETTDIN